MLRVDAAGKLIFPEWKCAGWRADVRRRTCREKNESPRMNLRNAILAAAAFIGCAVHPPEISRSQRLFQEGKREEAILLLEEAYLKNEKKTDRSVLAYYAAELNQSVGNYGKAVFYRKKRIEILGKGAGFDSPEMMEAYNQYGSALMHAGDTAEAAKVLDSLFRSVDVDRAKIRHAIYANLAELGLFQRRMDSADAHSAVALRYAKADTEVSPLALFTCLFVRAKVLSALEDDGSEFKSLYQEISEKLWTTGGIGPKLKEDVQEFLEKEKTKALVF